jgi:hypothetical protein
MVDGVVFPVGWAEGPLFVALTNDSLDIGMANVEWIKRTNLACIKVSQRQYMDQCGENVTTRDGNTKWVDIG